MREKSFLLSFLLFFICCAGFGKVELGIDILESTDFKCLRGKKVGVLTNNSSLNASGKYTWKVMIDYMVDVRAIFAPEHGLDFTAMAGEQFNSTKVEDIVVHACYGENACPKAEWLQELDVVVIDLKDIGVRYYTYVSSMIYTMFACFENSVDVIVLDRPNPISGIIVGGPCMSKEYNSFLGCIPGMPLLHGMTIGELALYAKDYASHNGLIVHENRLKDECVRGFSIDGDVAAKGMLSVVKMNGWHREMLWGDTSLTFNGTSPHIQNEKSCYDYAALSMTAYALCEPYADTIKFYCINEYTVDISARYFACFSIKNVNTKEVLEDLSCDDYSVVTNGIKLVDYRDSDIEKFILKIDDFGAIEPGALPLYLICKTQQSGMYNGLSDEAKILMYKHIGDSELVDKMLADDKIDFVYFINKWRKQADDFKKLSSRFYLYR